MTQDEIIALARKAGFEDDSDHTLNIQWTGTVGSLIALVKMVERKQWVGLTDEELIQKAVLAEREACAQLVVDLDGGLEWVAKEIRSRT